MGADWCLTKPSFISQSILWHLLCQIWKSKTRAPVWKFVWVTKNILSIREETNLRNFTKKCFILSIFIQLKYPKGWKHFWIHNFFLYTWQSYSYMPNIQDLSTVVLLLV
jgi:hypothetical protein